ncbi:MAG: prephenate dehydrogenase [Chloroflexota bacterium]|nr:prephenate dehydrogenase [Chloroflexota bacterium]
MDFTDARVAIVGLGLMGGSLAAALRASGRCREVVGVARRRSTCARALSLRFVDRATTDLEEGVGDVDVVVLATPVRDILDKVKTIGVLLKPGCLVMDVGSTKRAICEAMARMPPHVQPIGGHPMCGKETSGLTMAEPGLYHDSVFVLVPLDRTAPQALALAKDLVEDIGAKPLVLDAKHHDHIVAAISHLPYLLAVTLVNAAEELACEDPLAWELAAGGFRDTSRVAGSSLVMMLDILRTNRGPILDALHKAQDQLAFLSRCLEDDEFEELEAALRVARNKRRDMYR